MTQLISNLGERNVKIVFFALMLFTIYFLIIRPRNKEEKEKRTLVDTLKKGKEVTTIGGLHGTIVEVGEKSIVLSIDRKGSQITIDKGAISTKKSG